MHAQAPSSADPFAEFASIFDKFASAEEVTGAIKPEAEGGDDEVKEEAEDAEEPAAEPAPKPVSARCAATHSMRRQHGMQ